MIMFSRTPLLWILFLTGCRATLEHHEGNFQDSETAESIRNEPDTASLKTPVYGVDASWPMHSADAVQDPLVKQRYNDLLNECYKVDGEHLCNRHEQERMAMNRHQPSQMTNFTTAGYAKVTIPPKAFEILSSVWNEAHDELKRENWARGSIYTNHRSVPTDVLDVHKWLSPERLRQVEFHIKQVVQDWAGVAVVPTSTYGIRVYGRGSILQSHVDRLPLVLSAILHLDHDDEEEDQAGGNHDWPLEVIGHDGLAHNLTLKKGEMILYESHSIIHGRPFPFQGHFYANLFVHFEPLGYSYELDQKLKQQQQQQPQEEEESTLSLKSLFDFLLKNQDKVAKQQELMSPPESTDNLLPPYSLTEKEQKRWRQDYQFVRSTPPKDYTKPKRTPGATSAHTAAATGQLAVLQDMLSKDPTVLDQSDGNGWKPIHEAARGGHTKVLEWLIEQGVDVNERTNEGDGASPLWWALQYFPDNHPAARLLRRHGAVVLGPRGQ